MREIPAIGAQFWAYEFCKRKIFQLSDTEKLSGIKALASGSVAGLSCWFFSFPFDVVKTKIQCKPINYYPNWAFDGGFTHVAKKVYKKNVFIYFFII